MEMKEVDWMRSRQAPKARPHGHNAKATIEMPPDWLATIDQIATDRYTQRATIMREAIALYLKLNAPTPPTPPHSLPASVVPD